MVTFPLPLKKYLSIPLSVIYLIIIPVYTFRRMELPLHSMEFIKDNAATANLLIIILVFAVLLLMTQRPHLAFGIGEIILLVLFLINYYVISFRGGRGFGAGDIKAIGTAVSVLDNYRLFMEEELWYSILYFLFFIAFGFWCRVPFKGRIYHLTVTGISVAFIAVFCFIWDGGKYLENHDLQGYYWNWNVNGYLVTFAHSFADNTMEKPYGYSEKELENIRQEVMEGKQDRSTDQVRPNIIFIMNEAWSDLRVLGNLETSQPYMPFVDSLSENTVKGNLYVNILGGITAQSEYEALTGDSLALLPSGAIPYTMQVDHDVCSLADVLKAEGYQTLAIHPNYGVSWNRTKVYDHFGFDDFIELEEFAVDCEMVGNFVSDESNYDEIIYRYENRKPGEPLFLFDVTIQNHADYYFQVDTPIVVEKIGQTQTQVEDFIYDDIWTYVNLMRVTDQAFENLVEYFCKVDEPTIICMFGDHQPKLRDQFYDAIFEDSRLTQQEQTMRQHITPYVIWSNYDSDFPQYGDMSVNYLGAALMECAGGELPVYYKFLLEMQKEYPVITQLGCLDRAGNSFDITDVWNQEEFKDYRMLQYNHIIVKDYRRDLFMPLVGEGE